MRYKVGDKVKIKTWGETKKLVNFNSFMEKEVEELKTNRILTIKVVNEGCYYAMKESRWFWNDDMIKCLAKDFKKEIYEPINDRFEILDL